MARFTVGPRDEILVTAVAAGPISVDIPAGGPVIVDVKAAQDLRAALGAAIAIQQGDVEPDDTDDTVPDADPTS